jgi:twitching motility protein PilT
LENRLLVPARRIRSVAMNTKEIVLGLGPQKSLWSVAHIVESQLRTGHGAPRKVIAHANGVELEAARPGYEGEFHSFTLRLRNPLPPVKEWVQGFASRCSVRSDVADKDTVLELHCPGPTGNHLTPEQVQAVCDELSTKLRIPEVWRVLGKGYRIDPISPEALLRLMIKFKASDVHLYAGSMPVFRVDNVLRRIQAGEPLSAEQIFALIQEIAPGRDWHEFQDHQQCSFIYHQVGLGYTRVSAFIKAGVPHCTMRYLPEKVPSFEDLSIPRASMEKLASLHFGLVLVTGMTGSGKSTSVAALVDWINENKDLHILCLEDPVEYVHVNKHSVVSQRDIGVDIVNFNAGVRGALRHDPDVIVIGEMRDPDTIRSAINAAATGHLVISTLHASTASEVVNRIVSFFDPVERDLVKLQLRDALKCIICQRLVPKIGGGRMPALEFMFNDTKHIADGILIGNTLAIKVGMQQDSTASFIFEKYLYDLAKRSVITSETAREFSSDRSIFDQMKLGTYVIPSVESMLHH